jgi:hypothetical protein
MTTLSGLVLELAHLHENKLPTQSSHVMPARMHNNAERIGHDHQGQRGSNSYRTAHTLDLMPDATADILAITAAGLSAAEAHSVAVISATLRKRMCVHCSAGRTPATKGDRCACVRTVSPDQIWQ